MKPDFDHEPCKARIEALEREVRALKRQLAKRGDDPLAPAGQTVKRTGSTDWLDNLAPSDRRFMERKLGIKGKER